MCQPAASSAPAPDSWKWQDPRSNPDRFRKSVAREKPLAIRTPQTPATVLAPGLALINGVAGRGGRLFKSDLRGKKLPPLLPPVTPTTPLDPSDPEDLKTIFEKSRPYQPPIIY